MPLAVAALARYGRIVAVSRVWQSEPVGFADQPDFLNAVVLLVTPLGAEAVCREMIPRVERELGRRRDPANRNAPRTIDVDLLLFDEAVLQVDHHHIPDPEIAERPFLAVPLAEVAPEYVHPELGVTLASLARRFGDPPAGLRLRNDVRLLAQLPTASPPTSRES